MKPEYCRCDKPEFKKVDYITLEYPGKIPPKICIRCEKEWRKWKDILGTELRLWPLGTPFRVCHYDHWNCNFFCLKRNGLGFICLYFGDKLIPKEEYAFWLLQDSFEIVEEPDEKMA